MSANVKPTYYRLELDDYSAAAFTSFGKYYYGTLEDLRCFFGELAHGASPGQPSKTPGANWSLRAGSSDAGRREPLSANGSVRASWRR